MPALGSTQGDPAGRPYNRTSPAALCGRARHTVPLRAIDQNPIGDFSPPLPLDVVI